MEKFERAVTIVAVIIIATIVLVAVLTLRAGDRLLNPYNREKKIEIPYGSVESAHAVTDQYSA